MNGHVSGCDDRRSTQYLWDNEGTTQSAPSQRELTRGDDHLGIGSDRMRIVPEHSLFVTTPPDIYMARMSRSDGCPVCVTNYEVPRGVWAEVDRTGHFTALYRCHVCEHVWRCNWEDR